MTDQKLHDALLREHFKTVEGTQKLADSSHRIEYEEDQNSDLYVSKAQELYSYSEDAACALVRDAFEEARNHFATLDQTANINDWIHGFILTIHERNNYAQESVFQDFAAQANANSPSLEQDIQREETLRLIKANITYLVGTARITLPEGIGMMDTLEPRIKRTIQPRQSALLDRLSIDYKRLGLNEFCGLKPTDGPSGFEKLEKEKIYLQLDLDL